MAQAIPYYVCPSLAKNLLTFAKINLGTVQKSLNVSLTVCYTSFVLQKGFMNNLGTAFSQSNFQL